MFDYFEQVTTVPQGVLRLCVFACMCVASVFVCNRSYDETRKLLDQVRRACEHGRLLFAGC